MIKLDEGTGDIALLELRKNRLLWRALAAVFAASLPLACLGARRVHMDASQGLDAALLFWSLLGLPISAMLLGASGGAGLRAEPAESAEAVLPIAPRRRVVGAVLAAGIRIAALAALVLAACVALSAQWREVALGAATHAAPITHSFFVTLTFTLTHLVLTCFVCAYAARNAGFGALVGGLLAAIAACSVAYGLALHEFFGARAPFGGKAFFAVAASLGGGVWALGRLAPWLERGERRSWRAVAAVPLALAAGSVLAFLGLGITFGGVARSMHLAAGEGLLAFLWDEPYLHLLPRARKAASAGALVWNLEGELSWVPADGARAVLIDGVPRSPGDVLKAPLARAFGSSAWDEDGGLWVLFWEYGAAAPHRLYHGTPPAKLTLRTADFGGKDPRRIAHRGTTIGVLTWAQDDKTHFGAMPAAGRVFRWEETGKDANEYLLEGWADAGLAARVSKDGRSLSVKRAQGGALRWTLPGKAIDRRTPGFVLASSVDGRPRFELLVRPDSKGTTDSVAVCHEDGSVALQPQDPWKASLRDGTYPAHLRHLVAPPSLKERGRRRDPRALRRDGDALWVLVEGSYLAKVSAADGKVLERWPLPPIPWLDREPEPVSQADDDGFYYNTGRVLWRVGWDGSRRVLARS